MAEKMRWIPIVERCAFSVAAIVSIASAVYLSLHDQTAPATVMAGVFVLSVIFTKLDSIEVIKAFGIETKIIRDTLRDAKASLEEYKRLALLTSNHTLYLMSLSRDYSYEGIRYQNDLSKRISDFMADTGFDTTDVSEAQRHFVKTIVEHFSIILHSAVSFIGEEKSEDIMKAVHELEKQRDMGDRKAQEKLDELITLVNSYSKYRRNIGPRFSSASEINDYLSLPEWRDKFDPERVAEFRRVGLRIRELIEQCEEIGRYSESALEFIDQYGLPSGTGKLLMESKIARP